MDLGTHKLTTFLIEYNDPNKSEGGPITTLMEDTLVKAYRTYDRIKADPELSNVTLTRQVSVITRERIV